MPTYRTRVRAPERKKLKPKRRWSKRLPRDYRKLMRWAARGGPKDYEKLRKLAQKARQSLPQTVDGAAFERLGRIDRPGLLRELAAAEQHNVSAGFLLDGLGWLLDKVPWGNWAWPVVAAQSAIHALKGDGLNEVDEQYARLVGATYGPAADRPFVVDHWVRQTQYDSDFVAVWDSPDGHRLIAVRGTQDAADLARDALLGLTGALPGSGLEREFLSILAGTDQATVVDVAGHSLGAALALQAYRNRTVYDAVHETYLYNPAYSPVMRGLSDAFERDENVRYFVNTGDLVSMGGQGHRAPANVVYRSHDAWDPVAAHRLAQWQGAARPAGEAHGSPALAAVHARKVLAPQSDARLYQESGGDAGSAESAESAPQGGSEAAAVGAAVGAQTLFDFGL